MTSRFLLLWALIGGLCLNLSAQTSSVVREAASEFQGIKTIKVDGQFCKIELSGTDGATVSFAGKLISDKQDEAYQLVNEVVNGTLSVAIKYPAQGWTTHSGEVTLKVPAGITIDINTTSGTVKADNLVDANFKALSRSGNLEIANSKGSVNLESITGVVKLSSCEGTLSAKSKSGNQFLTNLNGLINASSTEGDITLSQSKGSIVTESTSGKHSIDFHEGSVNAKSVNGSIKISEIKGDINVISFAGPLKLFKTNGIVNLQTTAGEQVGTRVMLTGNSSFKSTEGKIRMQIDNKTDEVTFMCKSATAFIQARGQSKKKTLKLGKGPIVITSESTTGGQVYN
ncbi:MAG: DUF4097 family beta strand repeat-containing protein [Breznakibacter sp.]